MKATSDSVCGARALPPTTYRTYRTSTVVLHALTLLRTYVSAMSSDINYLHSELGQRCTSGFTRIAIKFVRVLTYGLPVRWRNDLLEDPRRTRQETSKYRQTPWKLLAQVMILAKPPFMQCSAKVYLCSEYVPPGYMRTRSEIHNQYMYIEEAVCLCKPS